MDGLNQFAAFRNTSASLSILTSDQRWGVMLEFEDVDPHKFAQLVTDAPDWVEWIG